MAAWVLPVIYISLCLSQEGLAQVLVSTVVPLPLSLVLMQPKCFCYQLLVHPPI